LKVILTPEVYTLSLHDALPICGSDTSLLIGQALADHALDRLGGALRVRHVERRTLVVAEVEFAKVALEVLLRDVVVHAVDPALRSEEHTSELQSRSDLVCRLLL